VPNASNLVGLCIGLLPAAAICTAQTVSELLPAAVEAVLIAFRTGLRALESRNLLGQGSAVDASWSAIVGIQEKQALAALIQFCEMNVRFLRQSRPWNLNTNITLLEYP